MKIPEEIPVEDTEKTQYKTTGMTARRTTFWSLRVRSL